MDKVHFGLVNWGVLCGYLAAMMMVGAYFTRRASASTNSFFVAGGKIPAWAAGFSIYATTLSAITFMAVPEESFLTDWSYAIGTLSIVAIIPLLTRYYIPFFRKLKVTTAYEYLESRFGLSVRVLGSLLFIVFNLGRVAIVVYLPALAITSVSDIDPMVITLSVGVLCIIYTFLGGIEGVIWSDVIQGILLLVGAVLVLVFAIFAIPGGIHTVLHDAVGNGKFITSQNFTIGAGNASLAIIFVGNVFNSLQQYTANQDVVQRYQSTDSAAAANRSLWTNGVLTLIGIPLFFGMGTALYSFYKHAGGFPESLSTAVIVPYFVVTNLPVGISGLLIVAIFAACQSTVSSGLNGISACVVTDFKQRLFKKGSERQDVWIARIVVVVAGIVGVGGAAYLVVGNRADAWNLFLGVIGLLGVPVAALFALGIFTRRGNTPGALIGFVIGTAAAFYVAKSADLTPFAVSTISFVGTFLIGYLASWFFPGKSKNVTGLTVYSIDAEYDPGRSSQGVGPATKRGIKSEAHN